MHVPHLVLSIVAKPLTTNISFPGGVGGVEIYQEGLRCTVVQVLPR
jgi:hypothetical protein